MTRERRSESIVSLNTKMSAINLRKLKFRDSSNPIEEARFVILDAGTGYARTAIATDYVAWINFLDSTAPSVTDFQADNFDPSSPVQDLEAGGLSGIEGAGIELGIPLDRWYVPGAPNTPAPGMFVLVSGAASPDDGKPKAVAKAALATDDVVFGVITRVEGDTVFFIFSSLGWLAA